nr:hypothetical protein [Candidatus Njordarchaeota archaeon]
MNIIHNSSDSLKLGLKNGNVVVAVYGPGHVGLAISVVWLRAGEKVIGVHINEGLVKSINQGVSPTTGEPGIPEAISRFVAKTKFKATTDSTKASSESDVKIIAVPTILTASKRKIHA